MHIKKIVGKLHLWLGLTSGLLVFIISITGCLYAFQVEISDLTQPFRFVDRQNISFLLPSQLQEIAQQELPDKKIHSVLYESGDKAAVVSFYSFDPEYYYLVYLNPYTGEVLKVKDMDKDFFRIVLMGHFYLWLPPAIGQPVVATATLVFVGMLISGLILWWPKNKGAAKQRFTIKWSARWRRKNYDLHNVLGFYATWVVLIMALTGLVWGFQWFANATYWATSGGKDYQLYSEPLSNTTAVAVASDAPVVDKIWHKMKAEHAGAQSIEVHFPEHHNSSILAAINDDASTYWRIDYRFFDQFTLEELSVSHQWGRFHEASAADKLMRMNYDIHVGAIMGLPGKILAFFASLIAASLPVTGFYIWWGRKNKKQKDKPYPTLQPVSQKEISY
ncbi:PepSY-associated TM helix domain-containing protein [Rhodocytophaga aerolata]|uniref:PepSY-associated TM helix domain-containing protein n=1 Tax=Rhodocytophaga aerolata TaxID=455078 RepID=A0ABT8R6L2_9BACT|nr:PepSY-associated TM helix domain-containing protein [Rhodocytophaga aerolata]MDO1446848.1 PepSY-associated TM helix domain-containing protein [Rhodocytophaga aerolata]